MATNGHFCWPSVGSYVAAYGQFFMAANKESRKGPRRRYYKLVTQARPSALAYVETQRTKDQPAHAQLSPVGYQNSGCTA